MRKSINLDHSFFLIPVHFHGQNICSVHFCSTLEKVQGTIAKLKERTNSPYAVGLPVTIMSFAPCHKKVGFQTDPFIPFLFVNIYISLLRKGTMHHLFRLLALAYPFFLLISLFNLKQLSFNYPTFC